MSEIEGKKEFNNWIDKMKVDVQEEVRQVVSETAYKIESGAKLLCPVDTGHLRRSINTQFDVASKGLSASVGTNLEYSEFVEFGTRLQLPQPYLFPTWHKFRPILMSNLESVIKKVGE